MQSAILCFIKETCQGIGGAIMLKRRSAVRGSQWFGKVSTVVFYASMSALVLFKLSGAIRWLLVAIAGSCMLVAFIGYLRIFIQVSREDNAVSDESEKG